MSNDSLRTFIALVVTCAWAFALGASVYTGQYKGIEVVTPVMMIVAGFLFGYQIQVRRTAAKEE